MRLAARSVSAMNLSYVVDSGASRDALPNTIFKKWAPSRTVEISTSNGAADTNVYAATTMPRLQQGQGSKQKRKVLGINGPPCSLLAIKSRRRKDQPHSCTRSSGKAFHVGRRR